MSPLLHRTLLIFTSDARRALSKLPAWVDYVFNAEKDGAIPEEIMNCVYKATRATRSEQATAHFTLFVGHYVRQYRQNRKKQEAAAKMAQVRTRTPGTVSPYYI